jgi:mannan endo-1,4-beta-mannosidase
LSSAKTPNLATKLSKRGLAWWALSGKRARLTAVGALVLVAGLMTTSVFVWVSPANPITEAVAAVSKQQLQAQQIVYERNSLLSQVVALQKVLSKNNSSLAGSKAQLASLQQQLWAVQGKLDAATAAQAASAAAATQAKKAPVKKPTTTTASVISAPSKASIVAPASRYFGMFTDQAPFNWASYNATAAKIGSTPNSVGYFGGWDQTFRPDVVQAAWKRNTLPVLTWESRPINAGNGETSAPAYSLPNIIAGNFDEYLRTYAKAIVTNGLPMGIRLDHEMNGIWYPWAETDGKGNSINGNNVGDYVRMWQHVHDIFQAEGANSLVVWIWAPNITNNLPATHKIEAFINGLYPGDDYVDEVGLSGYLRPAYKPDNDFTFDYTFGPSLVMLRKLTTKPIYLAEIGASETGGHKAAWVNSLFAALSKPENHDIVGFSWFSLAVTTYTEGVLGTNDWRIDSRPDSLAAFIAGITNPADNFVLVPTP